MLRTVTKNKDLALIFFAVVCQIFACMNISFMNKYIEVTRATDAFFSGNRLDLTGWVILTIFSRIFGAYFIGKYADKAGIFKSILFISKMFALISIMHAVFFATQEISNETNRGFYLFRVLYCFLEPAALILPYLYVLESDTHLNHYKISVLFLWAMFVAKSFSYHFIHLPVGFIKLWYLVSLIGTCLSWGIYHYIGKHSELKKVPKQKNFLMPLKVKILTFLFGAAGATGVFYHHYFASYYSLNIKIIDDSADLDSVTYYALCAIFLLPAAKLHEAFGLYRMLKTSLCMLFILGINFVFSSSDPMMYIIQQILFSFSSALYLAPILAILYKIYKDYPSVSAILFWFILGFSMCTLLALFEQQVGLQKGFGWCVYSASAFLCFIAVSRFNSKGFLNKKLKMASTEFKLFEA